MNDLTPYDSVENSEALSNLLYLFSQIFYRNYYRIISTFDDILIIFLIPRIYMRCAKIPYYTFANIWF